MKHLKKFNEHFDSEEIKSMVYDTELLPYLQGELFNQPLRKVKELEFQRDGDSIVNKLLIKFPHLNDFYVDSEKTPGITFIYKKNKDWFVSIGVGLGTIGIMYKYNKANDDKKVLNDLTFRGYEFIYFKEWQDVTDDEIINIVQYNFLPILLKCGFRKEIKQGEEEIRAQQN